jgi:hypothetical protein
VILDASDAHRILGEHADANNPTLLAVQDLILSQPGLDIDPGDALDAARVLLAAHARELASMVAADIRADRERNPGGGKMSLRNYSRRGGMMTVAQRLDQYADDLDAAGGGS